VTRPAYRPSTEGQLPCCARLRRSCADLQFLVEVCRYLQGSRCVEGSTGDDWAGPNGVRMTSQARWLPVSGPVTRDRAGMPAFQRGANSRAVHVCGAVVPICSSLWRFVNVYKCLQKSRCVERSTGVGTRRSRTPFSSVPVGRTALNERRGKFSRLNGALPQAYGLPTPERRLQTVLKTCMGCWRHPRVR
jgi:hypothetical protein